MKNPLTASERRGIIVVAGLALTITSAGWIVSTCQRPLPEEPLPEVEILVSGDSATSEGDYVGSHETKKRKRRNRRDSAYSNGSNSLKTYRRRSPRDEFVN